MIITALKLTEGKVNRGDIKILNSALRELRYAFKLFSKYRQFRKVTIFGSARTHENDPAYHQAVDFAKMITENGYMVITGAGEGIMKGAQEGAGRDKSFGVNIQLPFEQTPNIYIDKDPKLVTFKYFFARKLVFMKEADAVVLFPGGFGTLDEGFEALTLMQTGKGDILPIVLVDVPGGDYWKTWRRHIEKSLLGQGLISPEDMSFIRVTDKVEDAIREIVNFYRNYHSYRYVKDRLVVRLQNSITDEALEKLNVDFKNILSKGRIERCEALPEESNEPELSVLPRLSLYFNQKNFGRFRQFIDAVNSSSITSSDGR